MYGTERQTFDKLKANFDMRRQYFVVTNSNLSDLETVSRMFLKCPRSLQVHLFLVADIMVNIAASLDAEFELLFARQTIPIEEIASNLEQSLLIKSEETF